MIILLWVQFLFWSVNCEESEFSDPYFYKYGLVIGMGVVVKKVMFSISIAKDKKGRQMLSVSRMTYCGVGMFLVLHR